MLPFTSLPNLSLGKTSQIGFFNWSPEGCVATVVFRMGMDCTLFNALLSSVFLVASFRLTYFLQKWKNASVIIILKLGNDSSQVDDLNPFSLLSAITKVFNVSYNDVCKIFLEDLMSWFANSLLENRGIHLWGQRSRNDLRSCLAQDIPF